MGADGFFAMELTPHVVAKADCSLIVGLALLLGLVAAAGKCERLVVTGSPDAPPYLWQDPQNPKQLMGASADLLQQVAKDLGIKVQLLYAGKRCKPWMKCAAGAWTCSRMLR